jgi:hypothetical protein
MKRLKEVILKCEHCETQEVFNHPIQWSEAFWREFPEATIESEAVSQPSPWHYYRPQVVKRYSGTFVCSYCKRKLG